MTNGVPPPAGLPEGSGIVPARTGMDLHPRMRAAYFAGVALLAAVVLVLSALVWAGRDRSEGLPPITTNGEWRRLAPESSWSVWRPPCVVQSILADSPQENPATVTLSIATVGGTGVYLVGVSSSLWTDISDKEKLSVDFGFDDEPPEEETSQANRIVLGHSSVGKAGPGFLVGVDADFLRLMAQSATMEVYRDGSAEVSIDMSGAAKALEILQACAKAERATIEVPVEELYSGNRPPRLPEAGNADR